MSEAMETQGLYAWHVHHEGALCERLTEPIEGRRAYIRGHKPSSEIATRLRLLKVVVDQKAVAEAWRVLDEAIAAARRVLDETVAPAHARECPDCPWDGQSIFPGAR